MLVDIIGSIGTACFVISGLPQAVRCVKQGHGDGISIIMAGLWSLGEVAMLAYIISRYGVNEPFLLANYAFNTVICNVILFYCIRSMILRNATHEFGGNVSKPVKMVIACRRDLSMPRGKLASQVAHASSMFLLDNNESDRIDELKIKLTPIEAQWLTGSFTKVVVGVDSEDELRDLIMLAEFKGVQCHAVIDEGRTEFHGNPTLTCVAFGPAYEDDVNEITGRLKLM